MKTLSLFALFAALATSVQAQSLDLSPQDGAPAVEASGSSSTGVDLLGDSVSSSVGGGGALAVYSRSGRVAGEGGLDVSVGDRSVELQSAPLEISGANGQLIPAFALDPDGNGLVDSAEGDAARQFAAERGGRCDGVIVSTSAPEQIIAIERAQAISLMLVCADPDGLEAEQRAAIAANPALMDRLADAGYGLGDVAGIVLDADGRGTLYLAAS